MLIFLLLISSCPISEARLLRGSCYYCLFSPPGLTSVLLSTSHLVGVPEQSPCYQNATQSSEIASRRFPHRCTAGDRRSLSKSAQPSFYASTELFIRKTPTKHLTIRRVTGL